MHCDYILKVKGILKLPIGIYNLNRFDLKEHSTLNPKLKIIKQHNE